MLKILKEKYKVDINDYEIIKKINQGGFGIIYLVKNKRSKEELVAKVNLIDTGENNRHNQFINRELVILMRVQHPTIIPLRGFSFTDFNGNENITILMDYMKEGSVSLLIDKEQKGRCSTDYDNTKRQIILAGVARGMMILHSLNIIHRDLSSGNILLDEKFHPLITDFGLSKFFDPQHSKSQTLVECGTLAYMAPEVIESDQYNTKADVYSFGILMYEIITGTRAYSNLIKKLTGFKLKMQIINGLRPDLNIPMKEGLKELITKCLLKNPDDRPTFSELFEKLSLSYSNELLTDEDEVKYCLDDVDLDEFLEYIENITETENNRIYNKIKEIESNSKSEIQSLKRTIQKQADEIELLKEKIISQEKEISRLETSSKGQKISPVTNSIGNFFYAAPTMHDDGIYGILKKKETNRFNPLFVPSQSSRDIYELINPNTNTFFGTYSKKDDFFIDFKFEKSIRINGVVIYSQKSHFPKSFKILVNGNVMKSIENADELNKKDSKMTINFNEVSGSLVRFKQTGPNWEGGNVLFIRRIEILSPEDKYSNGVFTSIFEEKKKLNPRLSRVLVTAAAFNLDSFYLLESKEVTFIDKINSWFQVEFTHGSAIITGFRIVKSELKSYKVIASDDAKKPDDLWIKLFEVNEKVNRNKRTCDIFELSHQSPLVSVVRVVLTDRDWQDKYNLKINNFDIFGYYF